MGELLFYFVVGIGVIAVVFLIGYVLGTAYMTAKHNRLPEESGVSLVEIAWLLGAQEVVYNPPDASGKRTWDVCFGGAPRKDGKPNIEIWCRNLPARCSKKPLSNLVRMRGAQRDAEERAQQYTKE